MGAMECGHHSSLRLAHFFELADQLVLVTMVVEESESNVHMFYVKMPVEFGPIGKLESK